MLEVRGSSCMIILICLEVKATENFEALVEELAIEDESHEPEAPVLLQYLLMNRWRDLDLTVDRDWQPTGVEKVQRSPLVSDRGVVLQHDRVVISKFIELLLVDEAVSFID